jgi:MFS family permease
MITSDFSMYFLFPQVLALIGINAYTYSKGGTQNALQTTVFRSFQLRFVAVYLLMMSADWLQGPYVYKLYDYYGFSRHDNGVLFIAGFGSSMVFGTWAGPIADKYGRKLCCVLYGISYILSCLTKHFPDYNILMLGRVLGGFATSILWSAFESWMVSEHNARGFDSAWMGSTFSWMVTGNGLVAIFSGFVAQAAVTAVDHPVAPFDVSILVLLVSTVLVWFSWSENYGNVSTLNVFSGAAHAVDTIFKQKKVLYLGLMQSFFEGAMYTFVFMWTPALQTANGDITIPHGLIFASFMMSCSLGGTLYSILENAGIRQATLLKGLFGVSFAMMGLVCINDKSPFCIMAEFCIFEVCVGVFWPTIGTLRSKHVPEDERATIMNLFRVPLNAIVCAVLYFQGDMHFSTVFTFCTVFHFICVGLGFAFESELKKEVAIAKEAGVEIVDAPAISSH